MQFPEPYIETKLPSDYKYSLEGAASKVGVSRDTIMRALKRNPTDRRYLKGLNPGGGQWIIYAWDLQDFEKRIANDYRR